MYEPALDWIKIRCDRLGMSKLDTVRRLSQYGLKILKDHWGWAKYFGGITKKCQSEINSYTRIQMDTPPGSPSKSASLAFSAFSSLPYCPAFVHQVVFHHLKFPTHARPAEFADWLHIQDPTAVCCLHKGIVTYRHSIQSQKAMNRRCDLDSAYSVLVFAEGKAWFHMMHNSSLRIYQHSIWKIMFCVLSTCFPCIFGNCQHTMRRKDGMDGIDKQAALDQSMAFATVRYGHRTFSWYRSGETILGECVVILMRDSFPLIEARVFWCWEYVWSLETGNDTQRLFWRMCLEFSCLTLFGKVPAIKKKHTAEL